MRAFTLSLAAVAISVVSAHEYPYCDTDNCYNNLVDPRFADKAETWCPEYLASVVTSPDAIPEEFGSCGGDVKAVSSACSCITYVPTSTVPPASSTSAPPASSTSAPPASSTPTPPASSTPTPPASSTSTPPVSSTTLPSSSSTETKTTTSDTSSNAVTSTTLTAPTLPTVTYPPRSTQWSYVPHSYTHSTKYTTSTIMTTTTRTVTQCPTTVSNCPAHSTTVVTETIVIGTTVWPVDETSTTKRLSATAPPPTKSSIGTVTTWAKPSSTMARLAVTAGAARVGVEAVAAAAGLLAAALL